MAWILVPSLVSLRAEFNELAPARDKASDGAIGDGEHSQNSSDHNPDETGKTPTEDADDVNEVHAIDVDKDLRREGWTMERAVQIIVLRHRSGRDDRLQNVIYNRRIWSRSWGWTARAYTGPNPHDHHAHFSARYTTAQERDTRPWGLLEADVALSDSDWTRLEKMLAAVPGNVWNGVAVGRDENRRTMTQMLVEGRTFAAAAAGKAEEIDTQMDAYAAAEAERDATAPDRIRAALGVGQAPEVVAATLRSVPGVDWAAVGRALTQ